MGNKLKFDTQITDVQQTNNPLFSKAKAYIMYVNENRNKSSIKKEVVESALSTLPYCPVIGEFIESIDDFGGHGGKIEISSEGIKYIQTTRPFGVVTENPNIAWEFVTETDGTIREYLTCDVYLWNRYPEVTKVVEGSKSQSMEISEVEGEVREDGIFEINSFVFSALTILGDNVEPCFESASIVGYSLNKDEFKQEFDLMVKELKKSFNLSTTSDQEQGGAEMQNKNFESTENVEEKKALENHENEEVGEDNNENFEHEGQENADENEDKNTQDTQEFALTAEQTKAEIRRVLRSQTYKDDWGYDCRSYWYIDHDDEMVYAEDSKNNYLVSLPYGKNGDSISIDFTASKRVKVVYSPLEEGTVVANFEFMSIEKNEFELEKSIKEKEEEFNSKLNEKENTITLLNNELTSTKEKTNTLEVEVEGLRKYKAENEAEKTKEEKEAIFEQFSGGLTEEEMKPIKDEIDNLSAMDIKVKLNEVFTAKNLPQAKKFKSNTDKEEVVMDIAKKDTFKSSRYYV